jgi:hypothetical protein
MIYLPTDEESAEGIGSWNDESQYHDFSDGYGQPLHAPVSAPTNLAAFEQDRYARLLREHGTSPAALVNGSIGATRIPAGPASCVTCRQPVPVDFDYCG